MCTIPRRSTYHGAKGVVIMEQAFWLILFLAVVGIAALIAAAMMWQKESIQQPGTPTGQRSYQEEYSAPDFTESAGFAVTMYPSTDILIPGRFWLINRKTAEIEYNVIPAGGVRLRVAQTGQLDVPDTYLAYQYENVATVLIDSTEVTLSQNPGRNAMASWTRNGFDYLLLCEEPQMNLLGGVIQDFVTQTTASTVSGQRVTQE